MMRTFACSLALLLPPTLGAAQVGHPPSGTPFRDIPKGHAFTAVGGYFGGSGGRFGIAPHDGAAYGFRYDIRTASALQMGIGFARADLQRFIVDPFVTLAERRSGPVDQTVTFAELNLQLNLTGGKTWRRLAPFVAVAGGLAFSSSTPADTSGFDLGNKLYLAPHAGTRLFITEHLQLRAEARATFWKLNYPDSFTQEPPEEPGTEEEPNAVIPDLRTSEWSLSPWLQVGLGYSFRW